MPAVGARYAFFLTVNEDNYTIITGYELGEEGVKPLDNSQQFQQHYGELEESFIKKLRLKLSHKKAQKAQESAEPI
jgi:hypothetical protein